MLLINFNKPFSSVNISFVICKLELLQKNLLVEIIIRLLSIKFNINHIARRERHFLFSATTSSKRLGVLAGGSRSRHYLMKVCPRLFFIDQTKDCNIYLLINIHPPVTSTYIHLEQKLSTKEITKFGGTSKT